MEAAPIDVQDQSKVRLHQELLAAQKVSDACKRNVVTETAKM